MRRSCALCSPDPPVLEDRLVYAIEARDALLRSCFLIAPRRHVPSFFHLTDDEQLSMLLVLRDAERRMDKTLAPHRFRIEVVEGPHVHARLTPRHFGNRWWMRRRARQELRALPDRMLKDVGLRPDQIDEVA